MEASALSVNTTLLIGAGCFAAGYVVADFRNKFANFLYVVVKYCYAAGQFFAKKRSEVEVPGEKDGDLRKRKPRLEIENLADVIDDFKMVLVVRNDLKMGKGKIAAQCSHATLGLFKKLHSRAPKSLARWEMCGQVKVVVKIESEEDLLVLQARAKSLNLPNHVTIDAGRTQIAPNSRTVMAILGPTDMVDHITGRLKLL